MSYEYVKGVEDTVATLLDFPVKFEANVSRGAVRAAAVVMQRYILPMIPRKTGRLAATLLVSTKKKKGLVTGSLTIGNLRGGIFWAHLVLGGTKPHVIRAKSRGALYLPTAGLLVQSVQHPGAKANNFMAVGSTMARDAAFEAAFDYVEARMRKDLMRQDTEIAGL